MPPRAVLLLALAAGLACGDDDAPAPELQFVAAEAAPDDPAAFALRDAAASEVRAEVFEATRTSAIVPTFVGEGRWQALAAVTDASQVADAVARGRTFVRRGGGLQLDVRMGAGDRGAFMGGVLATGAERAMIQVQMMDPDTLGARFVVRIHAFEGDPRPRDATPRYLARAVPRGTYRAWVDVPPRGARYVVEVRTVDRDDDEVAWAWASPMAVERPWLQ